MSFLAKLLNVVVWLPFVMLWLVFWPFGFLYAVVLCVIATFVLVKNGRDVLIVQNTGGNPSAFPRLQELPVSQDRLLSLDYASQRKFDELLGELNRPGHTA